MEARSAPLFGTGPVSPRPAPRRLRPAWTQPGGGYEVELRTAHEIGADLEAWRALAERSVEPALFADPDCPAASPGRAPGQPDPGLAAGCAGAGGARGVSRCGAAPPAPGGGGA